MKVPFFFCFLSVLLFLLRAKNIAAVTCNPMELSPCANAILSTAPPTASCCSKLKEQQPCFCQYERNPQLKEYIKSSNSNKVASICKVPVPKC
ncbi:non-specific lipid-transfer protein 2 [Dendrobium catenatum]|uniref:Non-specific lipid-transfer protein 2 n=1 Tax=Dendrobium catenatum TaxID=906689 RepID=A0A2I0VEW9_9ASPA|nr:non-specific lipid-transfer protein 2 [Dendrobium catenatum]PKU61913.1 Non-specific lipid-transfer protein 2 [Dendrobium catenatum]